MPGKRINGNINQVKYGAALSYLLIILNAMYGVVVTPYIIKGLGAEEYGVYKTIAALSSSLAVMDFGIGGTVQRYVAKYRACHQEDKIPNFMAMSLVITLCLNVLILAVSSVLFFQIDSLYGVSFSSEQLELAKRLFVMLTMNMLLVVIENALNGLITGHNKFVFGNGLKLFLLLFRAVMIWLLLKFIISAVVVVSISIAASVITFFAEIVYIKKVIKVRIKHTSWDKSVLKEAGKYTVLMFLTSIASQIFSNLDNIVIGAVCGPELVAVYSVGLLFFGMFQNLSAGVAGVMLPTVTDVLSKENGSSEVSRIITKAGKIQFVLLGAALVGFICIGKDFIAVWMGEGFNDVYLITLILLVPAMFELCINVCHSVLRVKNRLGFRTGVVISSAVLNAVLTIIFVKKWSYIGAAVATAFSYIICSLIIMNSYYSRVIGLPMLRIYGGILKKTVPCLIVAGISLYVFSRFVQGSWGAIAADILFFCLIYGAALLLFGLDQDEKSQIPIVKRFIN